MRAEKHLDKCDEECKYNATGICAFGLRNNIGCFLESDVQKVAAEIIIDAKRYNTVESIKSLINLNIK